MKNYRKIVIGVLIVITALFLLGIGVNCWIKYQLPEMLAQKNKSPYAITYKDLHYSLIDGYIKAKEITVAPKAAIKENQTKKGIYASVHSVEIKDFSIWSVLLGDHISARSITVTSPEIILYKSNEKVNPKNIRHEVVAPFEKVISVSDVFLYNGDVKIIYTKTDKAILNAANINIQLEGIAVNDQTLEKKIPFSFEKYSFRCDSLYYRANPFYHFTTKQIAATHTDLKIHNFKMIPEYSRREFVRKIEKEKDLFVVSAQDIHLKNLDWGFEKEVLFANVGSVNIDQASADIYRNKLPEDDLTKKPLYNKLLRDLDFNLKVDTLNVRNSLLAYEEEKSFDKGSGKLIFSQFNLTATNIRSGFRQKKMEDLKISVDCKFMDASPMHVDWRLNVLDKTDGFHIKGTIANVDAERVNAFSKPYINATTEGKLNKVLFNFTGNDERSYGEFALQYDNFKLVVYQKNDRKKKNKFLTAVGNLFVKNDSKGEIKGTKVEVERIPEKSFYNFFWRNIAEGLLKILT
ncbi:hypothetical protein [Flavobacterium sp.]|uniref:hypothetical protein n=1 Tax=Flavobacterium sp. TaxID=239 RepID=UPI0039E2EEA1